MSEKYEYKKRFHDLEEEENWLNEMSRKGLALKEIHGGFFADVYSFEPCEKRYTYRVDYNAEPAAEEQYSQYINFVKDTYGAECVLFTGVRIYFRKAEEDGDFPSIYTNIESRSTAEKNEIRRSFYTVFLGTCSLIYASGTLAAKNIPAETVGEKILAVCGMVVIPVALPIITFGVARIVRHYRKISVLKKVRNEKGGE